MKECKQCKKLTLNPIFCSKSCSATYNNKYSIKRVKKLNKCGTCKALVHRNKYCSKECNPRLGTYLKTTLGELKKLYKSFWEVHALIRDNSRRIYKNSRLDLKCKNCEYELHVEICHIKPIKDFPDRTLVCKINSLENLVALCRNCHWEFDNKLISV